MKAPARNLVLAACLLALGGYIWHETAAYPQPAGESMVEGLGPAFYPRLLAVVLAGLACLVAGAALVPQPAAGRPPAPGAFRRSPLRAAALVGILVAYRLLLPVVGFPLATFAVLVAVMLFLAPADRRARPAALGLMAACAALATAGVFLLFTRVVKVPIPMGTLFGG